MNKKLLLSIISIKATTLLIIFFAFSLFPFAKNFYYSNFVYPPQESLSVKTAYKTWDAQHYLYLVERGYSANKESNRFFPLFPLFVRLVRFLIPDTLTAGLLTANIFSFFAFYYFYLFVKDHYGIKEAETSVLTLLLFPTSFYFSLMYSESLFFFLSIACFYFMYKKKYTTASVFSFLLPLSRPVGIFILIPILLFGSKHFSLQRKTVLFLFSPVIGFLCYLWYMHMTTGSALSGYTMQGMVIAKWSLLNITDPTIFLRNLIPASLAVHGFLNSFFDRIFFISFLALTPLLYKKLYFPLFVYAFLLAGTPFLGSFMSYMRYLLVAFPLFIGIGIFLTKERYALLRIPIYFLFLFLQALFLIMHALNYWVA